MRKLLHQRSLFLCLERVTLRLGTRLAFAGTNWTWHKGERWAILGPDGGGKSLLVDALLGRASVVRGEIQGPYGERAGEEVDPEQVVALVSPEVQRRLILHETSFYQARWHSGVEEGERTVARFLSQDSVEGHNPYEVNARRGSRSAFERERRGWVATLGLNALLRRRLAHLSNGELRKALLVSALLRRPRLLILEDAYAGLDIGTRATLRRVVSGLMRAGLPVLLVTNRVGEIPFGVTHVLWVDRHKVIAQGLKQEIVGLWSKHGSPDALRASDASGRSKGDNPTRETPKTRPRLRHIPVLRLNRVTIVGEGKTILKDVTWIVREGECWLLLGPNGAGKSTLLNLIQGDHPQAYAQDIELFGRTTDSTQTLWQSRQQIGWMSPELHQHYPREWRAMDVVMSGFFNTLGLFHSCSRRQRAAALAGLKDLGLAGQARATFAELSFGQQRLVLLARAVVKCPRLLILDEPTQGMDATQRRTLLAAVDRVVQRVGCSLVFVTHHPKETPGCITHVLRLERGKVRSTRQRIRTTQVQAY